MGGLKTEDVLKLYKSVDEIWPADDLWHLYSRKTICDYIGTQTYSNDSYILNAGSGGSTYGISSRIHHVDIVSDLISMFPEHTVSSIEKLPFEPESFSDVICVGSVLNYCDAFTALAELSRVLKFGGSIIVEFDSSWGFEHAKSENYKKSAVIVDVEYSNQLTRQWIYSPIYIREILSQCGLRVVDTQYFHCISGLHYRKHQESNQAARYTKLDPICKHIPLLRAHSNNVMYKSVKL